MLTEFQLGQIFERKKDGVSNTAVAKSVGVSRASVAAALRRNCKREPRKARAPCKKIVHRRQTLRRLAMATTTKAHRKFPTHGSAAGLRRALKQQTSETLSVRQVQRELHSAGLRPFVRPKKPTRGIQDLRNRNQFRRWIRQSTNEWRRIVFSDESWLCTNEHTGKIQWCRNKKDVLALEQKCRWNTASVMIWGCIGWNFKSNLVFFPAKRTVDGEVKQFRLNSKEYTRPCLSKVVPDLVAGNRLFMQRSHTAVNTRRYFGRQEG